LASISNFKMKTLFTIILLAAVGYLGWQYQELTQAKTASEATIVELNGKVASLETERRADKARIAELGGVGPGGVGKTNWIQERNRNYQSSLSVSSPGSGGPGGPGGSGRGPQRGSMPTPPPSPTPQPAAKAAQPPTYFNDAQGRYWIDAAGARHYVQ
jgi:cell division protein FtsB